MSPAPFDERQIIRRIWEAARRTGRLEVISAVYECLRDGRDVGELLSAMRAYEEAMAAGRERRDCL